MRDGDDRQVTAAPEGTCAGPLVWFDVTGVDEDGGTRRDVLLECAHPSCSYVVTTGNFMDAAHARTGILRGSR